MEGSKEGVVLASLCFVLSLSACNNNVREAIGRTEHQALEVTVQPNQNQSPSVVKMGASWAEYHRSMSALKQHADFAIVGEVSAIAPAAKPDAGPVYQMVTLKVNQVAWTNRHDYQVPATVTFEQTGGTYQNVTYTVDDDPLFRVGEQVVVFFKEYSPGLYRVSGGPTGRFSLANSGVTPVVQDGIQVPTGTNVTGLLKL
jgi:hypothetical protein